MSLDTTTGQGHERAAAIPLAIAVMVVATLLIIVIVTAGHFSADRSATSSQNTLSQLPADDAVSVYTRALNARVAGEHTDFLLNKVQLEKMVGSGSTVFTASQAPIAGTGYATFNKSVPVGNRLTVQRKFEGKDNVYGYWQLYAVGLPDFQVPTSGGSATGSKLVAYFRTWIADKNNTTASSPRIVRAEFRPGRVADYYMIVDGPITSVAGGGAPVIAGPVHSNGLPDSLFQQGSSKYSIDLPSATCVFGARFSASSGDIKLGSGCSGYPVQKGKSDNVDTINVAGIAGLTDWAWKDLCSSSMTGTSPLGKFKWQCVPRSASFALGTVNVSTLLGSANSALLLVDGDVRVIGSVPSGKRVTVIAYNREMSATGVGGSNITVAGNVGYGSNASLGLYAGGDVIVSANKSTGSCPVNNVRAAMIAATGAVTMPPEYRVPFSLPSDSQPPCGSIAMSGSIVSHYAPVLNAQSGSTTIRGWTNRSYTWDSNLYFSPPPLTPLTSGWQRESYDEANRRCFTTTAPVNPTCA